MRNEHQDDGNGARQGRQSHLDALLNDIGLGDAQIARPKPSVRGQDDEERNVRPPAHDEERNVRPPAHDEERFVRPPARGDELWFAKPAAQDHEERPVKQAQHERREAGMAKHLKLYLAEEQGILLQAYRAFFESHATVEVVGASSDTSTESLIAAGIALRPDIVLLGVKTLQPSTVEKLESFRERCADVPVVLVSAFYDVQGIKALREYLRGSPVGCAYLLKHTIDTVDQLSQVVYSVKEGRVILDPAVMEGIINTGELQNSFLKELSPRELEVLSWMAKGYRNDTIAAVLSREPKTVERHINSIYGKLENGLDSRHPRVYAVLVYLKAAGLLSGDIFRQE